MKTRVCLKYFVKNCSYLKTEYMFYLHKTCIQFSQFSEKNIHVFNLLVTVAPLKNGMNLREKTIQMKTKLLISILERRKFIIEKTMKMQLIESFTTVTQIN